MLEEFLPVDAQRTTALRVLAAYHDHLDKIFAGDPARGARAPGEGPGDDGQRVAGSG
ncbi:hypothetical protein ACWD6P_05535 [Streptomyces sp. NPDC002446]